MAPAIRLAEDGYPVDPYQAQTIAFAQRRLRAFPETLRTFFPDDGLPPVPTTSTRDADRLVQPDLARTLRALAQSAFLRRVNENANSLFRRMNLC